MPLLQEEYSQKLAFALLASFSMHWISLHISYLRHLKNKSHDKCQYQTTSLEFFRKLSFGV